MERRDFVKLAMAGALTATAFALPGCEEVYLERPYSPSRRFDYYYYPDINVYFHISSGRYYYFWDGVWIYSRVLPSYYYLDPVYRVVIVITDRYPYLRNREHRRKFGGGVPNRVPRPQTEQLARRPASAQEPRPQPSAGQGPQPQPTATAARATAASATAGPK